ncbi:TPA: TIGR02584 family CRISPR-associated protein [Vibrio vulnificus]|uniref:CRISPR-associated ring nuclease Csm6 n=1 Tax=Vibrio vulnificus TaxID=672 RepID=UPI001A31B537|nr:TIGR02584 family CRISPR-associated protein [Vibrio vulnificus]HAS6098207.1 TIGR02584 family CRISPR-associated protein [Vibrio vulnificus]HAS6269555.1 TIGR02584 family CRISPR-associated protein [Vibrio vulnificus]HDY7426120.1 TIGR02584 family CRISPR-associated protein [Vibrio vulnificus]HDY8122695.1 TIGR02584 family CRISPR-associated protein [Vibrio vulnificus]
MKKAILLSIAGLTPQVITETLYGIHTEQQENHQWLWPEEIQIITTRLGKEQILLGLLTKDSDGYCQLEKLCHDYQRPVPYIDESTIYVIPDAQGNPVADARSKQDHEALASFIVRHVAELCAQDDIVLHASLAGGRKTMTFFLGYALALFAREQDRLSHVLVDEEYENNRHFYYPTRKTHVIPGRGENSQLDASKANVTLAEIPFIRHKHMLPKESLTCLTTRSYRALTKTQNALQYRESIHLSFNLLQREVSVMDMVVDFRQHPLELAFYAMFATQFKRYGVYHFHKPSEQSLDLHLTDLLLQQLERIAGLPIRDYSTELAQGDKRRFMAEYEQRATALTERDIPMRGGGRQDIARTYHELNAGMSGKFFSDKLNKLKRILSQALVPELADLIMPAQVFDKDNPNQIRPYSTGGQQKSPYGLWLKAEQISIR